MARVPSALLLGAALLAGCAAPGSSGAPHRPPNVVLVVVDDLGWTDLGCQGSGYYETPNVDRLAAEGARFTQAYAASAVCSPSRAALLTGRAPARVGVTDWIHHAGPEAREAVERGAYVGGFDRPRGRPLLTPRNRAWLALEEVTLAELLRDAGYATAHVGKWHLGPVDELARGPRAQGFDENHGGCEVGQPPTYFDPYRGPHRPAGLTGLDPRAEGEYLTDREADEAVGFVERNADRPFFLHLAHYAVHAPIQAPPELIERFAAKPPTNHDVPAYAAMIASVDRAVGRVLDALDRHGLAEDTLVIFTSDNGGASHFRATDNTPLRRGKGFAYEGGLRVPLIVRWPRGAPAGVVVDAPASGVDVLPTVAAACGVAPPAGRPLDGVDLAPAFRGGDLDRDVLTWHFPHYWWGTSVRPYSAIRRGDHKLIHRYETGAAELYDLAADVGEKRDLAAERPELVRALRAELFRRLEAQGARLPEPNPDHEGR